MSVLRRSVAVALALPMVLACARAPEDSRAGVPGAFGPSGFLGDYRDLRPGRGGEPRLGYIDAAVDFSGYTRVIIDPVVVWQSDEVRFAGVPQERREALARSLEAELRLAFHEEFLVGGPDPGAGTLRVRSALTAALAVPGGSDPGRLQYVEVEAELLDAAGKTRLAAAVDSKGGQPDEGPVDAEAMFRDWAQRSSIRVAALRSVDRGAVRPAP
jgi:hypothetical protein